MFSKVFRLEKKGREDRATPPRPSSSGDKRPNYYPLQQATLLQAKKRATVNDAQAEAMEQELDLLELVCRSDSLHRRLDELQAKYERMDDGMENLVGRREVRVGPQPQDRPAKRLVGYRISRSFEEPESKKPNFLQRIFGHRLSKSKDDLLTLDSPRSSSTLDGRGFQSNRLAPPPIPMRDRRSASEDMLSSKDLLERRPDKRQSWGSEVWGRDAPMFQCPAPPPPPPPPPAVEAPAPKGGGLKRKRAIRITNPHSIRPREPAMGSTESCSDSTDSDREGRARGGGAGYSRPREIPVGDVRSTPRLEAGWGSTSGSPGSSRGKGGEVELRASGKDAEVRKYDPALAGAKRSPGEGREAAAAILALQRRREAFAKDKRTVELIESNERPTRKTPRATSFEENLVKEGTVRRCPVMISEQEEQPCVPVPRPLQASPSNEQKIKPILKNTDRCEGEKPERPKTGPPPALTRSESSREVLLSRAPSIRRHNRCPSSPGVAARTVSPHKILRSQASLESCKARPSPKRQLLPHTCGRGYLAKAFSTEEGPRSVGYCKTQDLGKMCEVSDGSEQEQQQQQQQRAKSSSCQDLPGKLPTTASIQELDHFLTAIIDNLEAQLQQSGGGLAFTPRQPALEDSRRRRKEIQENEESQEQEKEDLNVENGNEHQREEEKKEGEEEEQQQQQQQQKQQQQQQKQQQQQQGQQQHDPHHQQQQQVEQQQQQQADYRQMKSGGMSECGACGRRWVEPRLLPCLHTLCTPCLHARAMQITPTGTTTPITTSTVSRNEQVTPTPGSRRGSKSSQEQEVTVASSASTTAPSPSLLVPEGDSGGQASPLCNGSVATIPSSTSKDEGLPITTITASTSPTSPDSCKTSPPESREDPESAATQLDSVIQLLTQLSPNSCRASPVPKVTVTPTPSPSNPPGRRTPVHEDTLLSPASTLDSRCSSMTKSSGRSSSCESKGVWVVWCPECGHEAEVPPGGVECFPLNYILQKQLVLEALNSSTTIIYCDLCHDEVVAEERCNTCPVNLCCLCSQSHARQRRTAHHKVVSLQEARVRGIREVAHTLVCSTHGEGEVGWWCRGCQEPLCAACLATLHCGHQTSTVEQEAPHTRQTLAALLQQAKDRMGELLAAVEELTGAAARVQQRSHTVTDQVNTFIDDYIIALEEHRHILLRQVRQACERSQRSIVTESQKAGQTAAWLRQGCDLTHDLLHHAGHAEALALAPLLTHRLKTLLREKVEGGTRWEKLELLREHRAGKVRGHRVQGVIADSPAHPAHSRLKPLCEVGGVVVGARVVALLVARDLDGQPITHGGESVAASYLSGDASSSLCGCSVRDREDGSYEIVFSPPVAGKGVLHVTLQGQHVAGSPLEITVRSGSGGGSSSNSSSTSTSTSSSISSSSGSSVEIGRDGGGGCGGSGGGDGGAGGGGGGGGGGREGSGVARQHTGVFHCCTFCSSGGDKGATCACGAAIQGYLGCGHNHKGHPGQKHWSCCAQTSPTASCTRPLSQYYQVTL